MDLSMIVLPGGPFAHRMCVPKSAVRTLNSKGLVEELQISTGNVYACLNHIGVDVQAQELHNACSGVDRFRLALERAYPELDLRRNGGPGKRALGGGATEPSPKRSAVAVRLPRSPSSNPAVKMLVPVASANVLQQAGVAIQVPDAGAMVLEWNDVPNLAEQVQCLYVAVPANLQKVLAKKYPNEVAPIISSEYVNASTPRNDCQEQLMFEHVLVQSRCEEEWADFMSCTTHLTTPVDHREARSVFMGENYYRMQKEALEGDA